MNPLACMNDLPSEAPGQALIMVVDDDVLERMCATYMFEDAGYRVVAAGSGDEALHQFEAIAGIRLLFTDVSMPGVISGAELARQVAVRWPQTSIIVTSGRPRPNPMPPDVHFHDKPYVPADVLLQASDMIAAARTQ